MATPGNDFKRATYFSGSQPSMHLSNTRNSTRPTWSKTHRVLQLLKWKVAEQWSVRSNYKYNLWSNWMQLSTAKFIGSNYFILFHSNVCPLSFFFYSFASSHFLVLFTRNQLKWKCRRRRPCCCRTINSNPHYPFHSVEMWYFAFVMHMIQCAKCSRAIRALIHRINENTVKEVRYRWWSNHIYRHGVQIYTSYIYICGSVRWNEVSIGNGRLIGLNVVVFERSK